MLADPEGVALGPGAAELLDELDEDLFTLLEQSSATGVAGEVGEESLARWIRDNWPAGPQVHKTPAAVALADGLR